MAATEFQLRAVIQSRKFSRWRLIQWHFKQREQGIRFWMQGEGKIICVKRFHALYSKVKRGVVSNPGSGKQLKINIVDRFGRANYKLELDNTLSKISICENLILYPLFKIKEKILFFWREISAKFFLPPLPPNFKQSFLAK